MAKRLVGIALLLASLAVPASATNISSADPTYPASFADIDSEPLRQQFNDLINDIDNLWAAIGPNFLEANQILGALISGKATALSLPSCFSLTNALTWRPGVGFGCNDIASSGGGGSLSPAPAFTVIAGPSGGSPAIPTAIALTANYLPLPSSNSIGGVESITPVAHQFMIGISTSGVPLLGTPGFSDITGIIGAVQLPTPSASSLGGTESIAVVPHNFVTGISTLGTPTQAQPSFGDISGNISVSQMASGTGASSSTYFRGDGTWAVPPGCINSGSAGQIGYYAVTGTAISPASLGNDIALVGGVLNSTQPADRKVSGTSDTVTSSDCGRNVIYTGGSNTAVGIAAASSAGLSQGCGFNLNNTGTATATLTPTTSTVNGKASLAIPAGTGCYIRSDATNYQVDYSACSALTIPAGSLATTPADNATCTPGQTWWDSGFFYICTASGTVKRVALSTF